MFLLSSLFFTAAVNGCARPASGCREPHDVYENVDCDGDGILDHVCTTTINANRWVALSTSGNCFNWTPDNSGVCTDGSATGHPTCGSAFDSLFGGGDSMWSHSQIGYEKRLPNGATGGVGPFTYEPPSNGCCADHLGTSYKDWDMWCESTGDPHIRQFNGETNHAYINGDYLLYKGSHLTVAARHMNSGNVAGNVAYSISFDGVRLEYYDKHNAYGNQAQRTTDKIIIDGSTTDANGQTWTYDSACDHIKNGNLACICQWTDGLLYLQINDVTMFKAERINIDGWNNVYGWNNLYLQIDPEDKSNTDTGMCTSNAMSDSQSGATHPNTDPYPESRLTCSNEVFTDLAGVDSTGTARNPYWCLPATSMRRMSGYPTERRRFGDIIQTCKTQHTDMLLKAWTICAPCQNQGYSMEVCLMDPCMMKADNPSMTDDEAAAWAKAGAMACTEREVAEMDPATRATHCAAGTAWSERYQSCLLEFQIKPSMTCSGTRSPLSGKYLSDCQDLCASDATCTAFVHDETVNQCSLYTNCALVFSSTKNIVTYVKAEHVAAVIAAGAGLDSDDMDDDDMEGPHASYGTPSPSDDEHSSGHAPDFSDVHDTVTEVHQDVEDLGDHVKSLHDSLEDSVTDLNDEMKELTDDMEESLTDLHDELEDSLKDLHDDLEEEVNNLNEDLTDGLDEAHKAVNELRAALADLHAATAYSAGQPPIPTYTGGQPVAQPAPTYNGQPYGGTAPQSNNDDDETAWKTVAIVSMVLTGLLICGVLVCAVGYIGCMLKK